MRVLSVIRTPFFLFFWRYYSMYTTNQSCCSNNTLQVPVTGNCWKLVNEICTLLDNRPLFSWFNKNFISTYNFTLAFRCKHKNRRITKRLRFQQYNKTNVLTVQNCDSPLQFLLYCPQCIEWRSSHF